eukprot:Sspe_Gene.42831::Locus_20839_Transcript_2_2_Confidence_0.667_Length_3461::g.42831::m.42831
MSDDDPYDDTFDTYSASYNSSHIPSYEASARPPDQPKNTPSRPPRPQSAKRGSRSSSSGLTRKEEKKEKKAKKKDKADKKKKKAKVGEPPLYERPSVDPREEQVSGYDDESDGEVDYLKLDEEDDEVSKVMGLHHTAAQDTYNPQRETPHSYEDHAYDDDFFEEGSPQQTPAGPPLQTKKKGKKEKKAKEGKRKEKKAGKLRQSASFSESYGSEATSESRPSSAKPKEAKQGKKKKKATHASEADHSVPEADHSVSGVRSKEPPEPAKPPPATPPSDASSDEDIMASIRKSIGDLEKSKQTRSPLTRPGVDPAADTPRSDPSPPSATPRDAPSRSGQEDTPRSEGGARETTRSSATSSPRSRDEDKGHHGSAMSSARGDSEHHKSAASSMRSAGGAPDASAQTSAASKDSMQKGDEAQHAGIPKDTQLTPRNAEEGQNESPLSSARSEGATRAHAASAHSSSTSARSHQQAPPSEAPPPTPADRSNVPAVESSTQETQQRGACDSAPSSARSQGNRHPHATPSESTRASSSSRKKPSDGQRSGESSPRGSERHESETTASCPPSARDPPTAHQTISLPPDSNTHQSSPPTSARSATGGAHVTVPDSASSSLPPSARGGTPHSREDQARIAELERQLQELQEARKREREQMIAAVSQVSPRLASRLWSTVSEDGEHSTQHGPRVASAGTRRRQSQPPPTKPQRPQSAPSSRHVKHSEAVILRAEAKAGMPGAVHVIKVPPRPFTPTPRERAGAVLHWPNMYIWGGRGMGKGSLDPSLFAYNISTGQWKKVSTVGDRPLSGRYGHTCVLWQGCPVEWESPAVTGPFLVCFGGYRNVMRGGDHQAVTSGSLMTSDSGSPNRPINLTSLLKTQGYADDLHMLDMASKRWYRVTKERLAGDPSLHDRTCVRGHTAVVHASRMWVFGGVRDTGLTNQLDCLNLKKLKWHHFTVDEYSRPPPVQGHSAVAWGGSMWVFGGRNSDGDPTNSLHTFNFSLSAWSQKVTSGDVPAPRHAHTSVACRSCMITFGGSTGYYEYDNGCFTLNLGTFVWRRVELTGHIAGRMLHTAVLDLQSSGKASDEACEDLLGDLEDGDLYAMGCYDVVTADEPCGRFFTFGGRQLSETPGSSVPCRLSTDLLVVDFDG